MRGRPRFAGPGKRRSSQVYGLKMEHLTTSESERNASWEATMRRMKQRVNSALVQHPVVWWIKRIAKYLWKFAIRVKSAPTNDWIAQSTKWQPEMIEDASCEFLPYRTISCPRLKWDDQIRKFCRIHFNSCWHNVPIEAFSDRMNAFIEYYSLRV